MGRLQVFEEPRIRGQSNSEGKARRDQPLVSGIGDVLRPRVSAADSTVVPAYDLTSKGRAKKDSKRRGSFDTEVCQTNIGKVGRSEIVV